MDQVVITNIKNNKVNDTVNTELEFDPNYSQDNDYIKYTKPLVKFELNKGNKAHVNYEADLTYLWYIRGSDIMIK